MKRANFNDTVSILVKAYLNDTLDAMNCHACAVGNLVAHGLGYRYSDRCMIWVNSNQDYVYSQWQNVLFFQLQMQNYKDKAKEEIDSTGYTPMELRKVEKAFMSKAETYSNPDGNSFDGLMAVVDVLAEIHNVDLSVREDAKKMFVKV